MSGFDTSSLQDTFNSFKILFETLDTLKPVWVNNKDMIVDKKGLTYYVGIDYLLREYTVTCLEIAAQGKQAQDTIEFYNYIGESLEVDSELMQDYEKWRTDTLETIRIMQDQLNRILIEFHYFREDIPSLGSDSRGLQLMEDTIEKGLKELQDKYEGLSGKLLLNLSVLNLNPTEQDYLRGLLTKTAEVITNSKEYIEMVEKVKELALPLESTVEDILSNDMMLSAVILGTRNVIKESISRLIEQLDCAFSTVDMIKGIY